MLTLPLEPTDDRANPVFKDAASCAQWLGQLQLTNLQLAHSKLLAQINEINSYPMRGLERLHTLEILRETAGFVQEDLAKKLIDKPLPLNDGELMVFLSVVQLWQALVVGYQRCLQAYIAGDKQLAKHGALICQRCLLYSGQQILEHLCTGYEFSPALWHQLHELYAFAEQHELHQTEVPDTPGNHPTNCVNSYVKTLLACYTNPAQLTRWQLQQMDRWLSAWSNAVTVDRSYTISKNDAQPHVTDLSGTQGLQAVEGLAHHDAMRYLAMVPLSKLLRVKTILLQQGQTPKQVGLGDHYDSQACLELLTYLNQCWCENKHKRTIARSPVELHAQLCYKPEGIYAHLTGQPFQQRIHAAPGTSVHEQKNAQELMEMGYPLENWLMKNESIMGARLTREDAIGGRFKCKQLIALRPSDAQFFMLGVMSWANVTLNGKLEIGVRYLPGRPEPVRIHVPGINPASSETCAPAFLLPALPSLNSPASLIVPRDWFQANRLIEVLHPDDSTLTVKLGFSVERGLDYERASFTAM